MVVAAVLLAFGNSFRGVMLFDDRPTIVENESLRNLGDWMRVLTPPPDCSTTGRPFANLTLALNYAFGGLDPRGYHGVNLAIHLAAALVLFGVMRRTLQMPRLRDRFGRPAIVLAAGGATLWAVHPLQTESVTYIVQRAEALGGLFYLLALYAFVRSVEEPVEHPGRGFRWRALAVAACGLGVASKEIVASAPLLVWLYDRTFVAGSFRAAWRRRRGFYLALGSTWLLLAALVWSANSRAGTAGIGTASSWHYLLTQCRAIVHYLALAAHPDPLVFDYGKTLVRDPGQVMPQAVVLLALVTLAAIACVRRSPWAVPAALFFAVLAPTSSLVPVATQTAAEHRMYLPLAALVVLFVMGAHVAMRRAGVVVLAVAIVACGVLTRSRNEDYASAVRLWTTTVAAQPDNPRAWSTLGQSLFDAGRTEEAIANYEAAVRLDPEHFEARNNLGIALLAAGRMAEAEPHLAAAVRLEPAYAQAHSNLGMALYAVGRRDDALRHLRQALALRSDYAEAHSNLGILLHAAGDDTTALTHCLAAVRLAPENAEAQSNLGMVLHALGRSAEAQSCFERALRLKPGFVAARGNLAKALAAQGKHEAAAENFRAALAGNPNAADAAFGLGNALLKLRRWHEAVPVCAEAVRLAPEQVEARTNLGTALFFTGRAADALAEFEAALALNPAAYKAHYFIGNVLLSQQQPERAREHFETALRLNPDYAPARQNLVRLTAAR